MLIHLITRIFWIQDSFTFTFYVAFTLVNFSDFDVGCIFWPALTCCIIVYSDQLLGAHYTLDISYHDKWSICFWSCKSEVNPNLGQNIFSLQKWYSIELSTLKQLVAWSASSSIISFVMGLNKVYPPSFGNIILSKMSSSMYFCEYGYL